MLTTCTCVGIYGQWFVKAFYYFLVNRCISLIHQPTRMQAIERSSTSSTSFWRPSTMCKMLRDQESHPLGMQWCAYRAHHWSAIGISQDFVLGNCRNTFAESNVSRTGILCIFLCIALGIANIFNPPIIIPFSIICLFVVHLRSTFLGGGWLTASRISGLVLIFVEVPLLLRICPTSEKFDVFIRRFTTNYMRAGMYGVMSLIQWLTLVTHHTTGLLAAAVFLIIAAICYLIAGLKGQGFVGSKTLGGQGVAQMIV